MTVVPDRVPAQVSDEASGERTGSIRFIKLGDDGLATSLELPRHSEHQQSRGSAIPCPDIDTPAGHQPSSLGVTARGCGSSGMPFVACASFSHSDDSCL